MKKYSTIVAICLCLLLCMASTTFAEEAHPYFSLVGGLNLPNEMTLEDQDGKYTIDYELGFFTGGALGYDLGDSFPQLGKGRMELEIGYRYNELKNADFATGRVSAGGDLSSTSFMVNAISEYKDYNPHYVPYVGLGVGFASVTMGNTTAAGSPMIDDDDTQFAYQLLTGLSIPVSETLTVDCGYRYFATLDPEFIDSKKRKVTADYGNHNLAVGLRFDF